MPDQVDPRVLTVALGLVEAIEKGNVRLSDDSGSEPGSARDEYRVHGVSHEEAADELHLGCVRRPEKLEKSWKSDRSMREKSPGKLASPASLEKLAELF